MKQFSIKEALTYGWNKMKHEFSFVFLVTVIVWGITLLSEGVYRYVDTKYIHTTKVELILIGIAVISSFVFMLLQIGFYKIFFRLYDGEDAELKDLYKTTDVYWKFFLASILQGIVVLIGLVFLIIPGIYFAVRYGFIKFLVIDKKIAPIEAFKLSSQITNGIKWKLFQFAFVLGIFNIFGFVLIVGFFVTIPVSVFAMVHVYRSLARQAGLESKIANI